jgi:Zn-dependent M28 family amino/carboxypeptidase
MLVAGLVGIALLHLIALAAYMTGGALSNVARWIGILQWLLLPGIVLGIFFNNIRGIVPGANDNLTGVFVATGIAKHMKESGVQLQNTELGIAILGSEEAGLRGAKVFAEKHKRAFEDVETVVIFLETFHDIDYLKVYDRDMNGMVKHDPEVCRLLKDAGKGCGFDLPYASLYLGSSDASAFTQAGWRAGLLAAMDPSPPDYYHTRLDNWDNMDEECLRKAIAVVCATIRIYDAD